WASRDMAAVFGVAVEPVDCHVHRWIDAMPQYGPGHAGLVAELRAGLPPTLAVAGGYLDGIGVPACVASGTRAAAALASPFRCGCKRESTSPLLRINHDDDVWTFRVFCAEKLEL
ncbi:MAG TPA: FAD-dependent oxidoreductase, partial [Gemmatimonadaceae bacterium]|nr:FAD-dependent oxidoreductase [Gemmatimonadaceae bacterium]